MKKIIPGIAIALVLTLFSTNTKGQSLKSDTIDILHYSINIDLKHLSTESITATTEIKAVPKMLPLTSFSLDFLELQIDSIMINNQPVTLFQYNDTVLTIFPPTALTDTFSLMIGYHGQPVVEPYNWGGFHFLSDSSLAYNLGVAFDDYPHNYGRVWFPCIDDFIDHATYDIYVKVKSGMEAVCGGTLQQVNLQPDSSLIYHWKLEQEIPSYLISVAVSDFAHISNSYTGSLGTIPIDVYVRPADSVKALTAFNHLPDMMQIFENYFGPYRWPRVGFVGTTKGAMEHATNIAFPRSLIQSNYNYDWLVAHELSHHWFGDLATCATAEDMWINEGWAVFCESIFLEGMYGWKSYKDNIMSLQRTVIQYAHTGSQGGDGVLLPLWPVPQEYTYGMTVYDKGGIITHTLRGYMGDSIFFDAVRAYLDSFAFSSISSHQLRDFFSWKSGINMNDFFDGWIFDAGFPHFSIDSVATVLNGSNYDITVDVRQKLCNRTNYTNSNRIEIGFVRPDMTVLVKQIDFSGQTGTQTYTLDFLPVEVLLDPEDRLADAITARTHTLKQIGTKDFKDVLFKAEAIQITDSVFIRAEHNWVAPDPLQQNPPGLTLSDNRYWKISGVFPSGNNILGHFYFSKGSYLDNNLIINLNDSLVILYRSGPGSEWHGIPFSKGPSNVAGYIQVDNLQPGEYTLAIWDEDYIGINEESGNLFDDITIAPNPSNDSFHILGVGNRSLNIKIFSTTGTLVLEQRLGISSENKKVNVARLPEGIYLVNAENLEEEIVYSSKISIRR